MNIYRALALLWAKEHPRDPRALRLAAAEARKSKAKKPSPRKAQLSQRKAARRFETAQIREAVLQRAGGKCECCGAVAFALQVDHFLGGVGRRRQEQSVATCWALTPLCHRLRTLNEPSAAHWNALFAKHCERHGYRVHRHVEHQPVPRRAS